MLIVAAGLIMALVALVVACKVRSSGVSAVMMVLALVFLLPAGYLCVALYPELIDGRFRTYKAFYREIQIGMSRDDVLAVLDRCYPKSGPRQRPKIMNDAPDALGFFMNPETSREPNCEGIFLTLKNDHVTKKEYSPD